MKQLNFSGEGRRASAGNLWRWIRAPRLSPHSLLRLKSLECHYWVMVHWIVAVTVAILVRRGQVQNYKRLARYRH